MELGQLRALRELRDRGSIAAVAASLHVTPSSVSQQLTALQRGSSVPLTRREGRRTVLTDAGLALAAAAVGVEVALAKARQAVRDFQTEPAGTVSVAAFTSAGSALVAPLLTEFADADGTRLALSDEDVAQDDFPALTARHDLVVAHRLAGSAPWPQSVSVEPLLFEPLDVAIGVGHPLSGHRSLTPEDLRGESWVAVHDGFPLEGALASLLSSSEVRIAHRINEFSTAAAVVAASGCLALMPRYTPEHHPGVRLIPLEQPLLGRQIDCLARPETLERANVQLVLSRLRSMAATLTQR
ncbi:LysR family transcriptional regulator [Parafrigoribacterium soli]|uniref:LysR family transcriptional regulator n=1 Tax=Parafrigoribacterium soli TaxID=3144663 RepID=UPI0032EF4BF1